MDLAPLDTTPARATPVVVGLASDDALPSAEAALGGCSPLLGACEPVLGGCTPLSRAIPVLGDAIEDVAALG